jgi:hypothetical protein
MLALPRRTVCRLLAGLAGVTVVVTGCGGGGGNTATTTVPVTGPPVATTARPPGGPQLQAITVQPGDLPAGWKATPASPPANQATDAAAFAQCVGAPNTAGDVVAVAYSPDFVSGSSVIASTATSYKSPADVQADTTALTTSKASVCFVQVVKARLTAALPKGSTVKSVTLKITPGAGGGPANVVAIAVGTVAFTTGGHSLTLNDDIVFLAAPRIEAHVDFYNTGAPVSAQIKAAVINKVSARVTNGS